jgi:predicted PurR-regulated permease PerM
MMEVDREDNTDRRLERDEQFWHAYGRYPYILARVALYSLFFLALVWLLSLVESVLFALLASLLIAYLIDPLIDRLESAGLGRTAGISVVILIGFMSVALYALIFYPAMAEHVSKIGEHFPGWLAGFEENAVPWLEENGVTLPPSVEALFSSYGDTIREEMPGVVKRLTEWVGGLVTATGAIASSMFNLLMIPVFTFYFLRDFDQMRLGLVRFFPIPTRESNLERVRKMDAVVGAWFRGQIQVALILAVLYGLSIALVFHMSGIGIKVGFGIGLLTGILNVIPYVGVMIGFVLSVLAVVIDWSGPWPLVAVIIVFGVWTQIEDYVIKPKIVGEKVGLSPVVMIIVLLLGGELFGILGVLLAIPAAGIVRALMPEMIDYYQQTVFYRGHEESEVDSTLDLIRPGEMADLSGALVIPNHVEEDAVPASVPSDDSANSSVEAAGEARDAERPVHAVAVTDASAIAMDAATPSRDSPEATQDSEPVDESAEEPASALCLEPGTEAGNPDEIDSH